MLCNVIEWLWYVQVVDHRRPGSQLKQCFAMSSNGCGMFSGNSGSFAVVLCHVGKRFVSASTSVIPSDQISPLGDIAPLIFSGASYASRVSADSFDSPIGRIPSLESFNSSLTAMMFAGLI